MNHQPRHLLTGPTVEEEYAQKPYTQEQRQEGIETGERYRAVGVEAAETSAPFVAPLSSGCEHPTDATPAKEAARRDAEEYRDRLVQRDQQQVVEPRLASTLNVLLVHPVANRCKQARCDTAGRIGKKDGIENGENNSRDNETDQQYDRPRKQRADQVWERARLVSR